MRPLQTERLELREGRDDDAPFILALQSDPDWLRFIGDRGVRDLETARSYVSRLRGSYAQHGFGLWVVTLRDGTPVGLCGLVRRETLPHVDLGFAFLPAHRGHGYAREAAKATVERATELGLTPLLAICSQDNVRSRSLLEKLGFRFDKLVKLGDDPEALCLYERP